MAEIKIEKKKPVWPWILGVLILAAILYFSIANDTDSESQMVDTTTEPMIDEDTIDGNKTDGMAEELSAVKKYVAYIDNPQMGLDHEYTNGALEKLIAAVRAKARDINVNIDADLALAEERAEKITEDPYSLEHADMIKEAGNIITRALKTLQHQNFPNSEKQIQEVENALQSIQPKQPTLEQKEAVKNFFSKAGMALTSMR